jgi:hypothetical protein
LLASVGFITFSNVETVLAELSLRVGNFEKCHGMSDLLVEDDSFSTSNGSEVGKSPKLSDGVKLLGLEGS